MPTASPEKIKVPRFPALRRGRPGHISRAAECLEVSAGHLLRVIKGERQSPELLRRYQVWCKLAKISPRMK